MGRQGARCLALLAGAAALLQLAPPARGRELSAAPVAGLAAAAAALPDSAWARIVGGKVRAQEGRTYFAIPEEEGVSDAQIVVMLVIALVMFAVAVRVALKLWEGPIPVKNLKAGKRGYISPLYKRLIELGFV